MVHGEGSTIKGGDPSYEIGAAVGGPISDGTLGFRLSGWDRKDGGWVDRVNPFNNSVVESRIDYMSLDQTEIEKWLGLKN